MTESMIPSRCSNGTYILKTISLLPEMMHDSIASTSFFEASSELTEFSFEEDISPNEFRKKK